MLAIVLQIQIQTVLEQTLMLKTTIKTVTAIEIAILQEQTTVLKMKTNSYVLN